MGKEVKLRWEGFVEKVDYEPGVKSEGVMDDVDDKDGLTGE